jgi:hypothetical protein
MTIDLERGSGSAGRDDDFAQRFAAIPSIVRAAPYDRFLSPVEYWERHVQTAGDAAAFWIARQHEAGRAAVGRIGANLSPTRAGVGYVGFFEAIEGGDKSVSAALLDAALSWLRERGAELAYGPIDRSTWYGYRFQVETRAADALPGTEEPFSWEPGQPPGYLSAFLAAGFEEAERYHSHGYRGVEGMRLKDAVDLIRGAADFATSQGYRFEPFSTRWEDVLPDMYAVGNACFTKNVLFEPIAWDDFVALYAGVGAKVDYRPSFWLVDAKGEKRGMMFAFVDRGYVVMKTVGVAPELRRGGLSLALLWAACNRGLELGLDGTLAALFKAGNASEGMLRTGFGSATAWRRDYALFRKALT